jgi:hypothetical protein
MEQNIARLIERIYASYTKLIAHRSGYITVCILLVLVILFLLLQIALEVQQLI